MGARRRGAGCTSPRRRLADARRDRRVHRRLRPPRRHPPRQLRLVGVRPGDLRPGLLAGVAGRAVVRHRPRLRVLGPPRQPRGAALRAVLLARCGAVVPLRRPGLRPRARRVARLPDRPRPLRAPVDRPHVRRGVPACTRRSSGSRWANFHPEALVITPLLFAWLFATPPVVGLVLRRASGWRCRRARTRRWRCSCSASCWSSCTGAATSRRDRGWALGTMVHRRRLVRDLHAAGRSRTSTTAASRSTSSTSTAATAARSREIARRWRATPTSWCGDATQPDRLRFYRDLLLPFGGLAAGGPLELLMALPQLLASVIGSSPYARIDPLPVHGGDDRADRRSPRSRVPAGCGGSGSCSAVLIPWLLVWAYVTNVAWSPSPIGTDYDVAWVRENPRQAIARGRGRAWCPTTCRSPPTYGLLPHLSHREQIYDWPNPFVHVVLGQ